MMLKKTLATSFTALALAGIAAGTASADGAKFYNENNAANCTNVETGSVPVLSNANVNQDCSKNIRHNELDIDLYDN
ncbi:hypothetical protein [Streptomyces sp. TS71-3]|uniref:hypothetical protein n=1 Tax=Streptomyces sp. TS71-3 TaxID=2733862 RepID=UPI001B100AE9|nr:hypothetical protein [Streptomyces sp. TS71-3]GHJ39547.1 hypothetical protein Sm713_51560 [Streptomyces sp. TS71-3]